MTRKEAKLVGSKHYTICKQCSVHAPTTRYTSTGQCIDCVLQHSVKWRTENSTREKEAARNRYAKDLDNFRSKIRLWQNNNRTKVRQACLNWAKKYPHKATARTQLRRAQKLQAQPDWIYKKDLDQIYLECRELCEITGNKYHVDHIVPLINNAVCGLHVPWNLQILSAEENIAKGNKFNG